MGNTGGLFSPIQEIPACACLTKVVCFTQDGETLYLDPDYMKCPEPGDVSAEEAGSCAFSVTPNPAEDIVTVSSSDLLRKIALYDGKGALLLERTYGDVQQMVLPVAAYSAGVYYLTVTLQSGAVKTEKLIVK